MNPQDPAFDNPDPETASRALARRHAIEELLDRRRTAAVRPLIAAALREDPYDAELLYLAARADWIDDANTSAREHLTQLLQREPHHTPARALLVMVLTEENQLPQAEEIVLSLLREHPRWPHLYVLYARVMLHALNVEKASALASEALRMAPDDADALRLRALCDLVQGTRGAQGPARTSRRPGDRRHAGGGARHGGPSPGGPALLSGAPASRSDQPSLAAPDEGADGCHPLVLAALVAVSALRVGWFDRAMDSDHHRRAAACRACAGLGGPRQLGPVRVRGLFLDLAAVAEKVDFAELK
jgi:tetratricopeptide (TPR) repeat protein